MEVVGPVLPKQEGVVNDGRTASVAGPESEGPPSRHGPSDLHRFQLAIGLGMASMT